MKIYKEDDARRTICPFMSGDKDCNCVSKDCHFWIPVLKIGKRYKKIDFIIKKLISYDMIEKDYIMSGYCDLGGKEDA